MDDADWLSFLVHLMSVDMKWIIRDICKTDQRPKEHFLTNLSIGASECILLRALSKEVQISAGIFRAIVFDNLEWSRISEFKYGAYHDGLMQADAVARHQAPHDAFPRAGLAAFLDAYLQASENHLVICENRWIEPSSHALEWTETPQVYVSNEVYHVLPAPGATALAVENLVWDSRDRWKIGACSSLVEFPSGDQWSEHVIEEVAANSNHLFTEVFDEEGYLIWTRAGVGGA